MYVFHIFTALLFEKSLYLWLQLNVIGLHLLIVCLQCCSYTEVYFITYMYVSVKVLSLLLLLLSACYFCCFFSVLLPSIRNFDVIIHNVPMWDALVISNDGTLKIRQLPFQHQYISWYIQSHTTYMVYKLYYGVNRSNWGVSTFGW